MFIETAPPTIRSNAERVERVVISTIFILRILTRCTCSALERILRSLNKHKNIIMKKFLFFLFITGFTGFSCTQQDRTNPQKRIIHTDNAPASVGVYSQAIQVGNALYLSGQIGLVPQTRELAGDDLESQTRQTLDNIKAVLEAADFTMTDVVKAQVFLDDMDDYGAFNEVYVEYFPEDPPARAVVEVSQIPLNAKVEIMVEAVK